MSSKRGKLGQTSLYGRKRHGFEDAGLFCRGKLPEILRGGCNRLCFGSVFFPHYPVPLCALEQSIRNQTTSILPEPLLNWILEARMVAEDV